MERPEITCRDVVVAAGFWVLIVAAMVAFWAAVVYLGYRLAT